MSDSRFDVLARHAASIVCRRTSLRAFAAVALLASARPAATLAAKAAKKARKKCKRQVGQCRAFFGERCELLENDPAGVADCIEVNSPCCDLFASCNELTAERVVECIVEAAQP